MSVFTTITPFILASGSPRRYNLLLQQNLDFTVCKTPQDFVEERPKPGEEAEAYTLRVASAKARATLALLARPQPPVLAADTIVCLDNEIFGKPENADQALTMLERLSGRAHKVITACCLLLPQLRKEENFALTSEVTFWDCPKEALKAYARSAEPLDKAGAYAIQESGSFLIRSIRGSWSNVVGLPVSEVIEKLLQYNIIGVKREHS